jgi:hypothetical protein
MIGCPEGRMTGSRQQTGNSAEITDREVSMLVVGLREGVQEEEDAKHESC